MELRPTPALILVAVLVLGGLAAGYIASQFEYEATAPAAEEPELLERDSLPDWASAPLPDFSQYTIVTERKEAFFSYLFPRIALANLRIEAARDYLEQLRKKESLSEEENEWLEAHASRLRVDTEDREALFERLDRRMDIIPPSLMIAQAANESAWGTSRFATKGNNLFGQWCFNQGCGLVPQGRPDGMSHEVEVFDSPYQSVRSYMTNLNRHNAYKGLRERRETLRTQDEFPDGVTLAGGLEAYSERGQAYVHEIRGMINSNGLPEYDERLSSILDASEPVKELDALVKEYQKTFSN
ncbi:MAG: glucosaminidase domain-containing protein [Pseudomonadota bacterium]